MFAWRKKISFSLVTLHTIALQHNHYYYYHITNKVRVSEHFRVNTANQEWIYSPRFSPKSTLPWMWAMTHPKVPHHAGAAPTPSSRSAGSLPHLLEYWYTTESTPGASPHNITHSSSLPGRTRIQVSPALINMIKPLWGAVWRGLWLDMDYGDLCILLSSHPAPAPRSPVLLLNKWISAWRYAMHISPQPARPRSAVREATQTCLTPFDLLGGLFTRTARSKCTFYKHCKSGAT